MPQRWVRACPDARSCGASYVRCDTFARRQRKDARTVVAIAHQSAQFSATLRVRLADRPGAFAALAAAIAEENGLLDAIDLVRAEAGTKIRDVTVLATDADHIDRIVGAV